MNRKSFLKSALAAAALIAGTGALADAFPTKPVRLIVPYSAGGVNDSIARSLAIGLSKRLGQQVVVENKPGGNTVIATQTVATAPPDGHTLYITHTTPYSMLPALYKRALPYNPQKDYTPVATLAQLHLAVVVSAAGPIKTMRDFVDAAKARPGQVSFSSPGTGQIAGLAMELLRDDLGLDLLHVPFQGANPAVQAIVAGQVDASMIDLSTAIPFIKGDKLRALAVSASERRPALPSVPTLAEAGFDKIKIPAVWLGIVGPGGMPAPVVARLNEEINKEMQTAAMRDLLATYSADVLIGTPAQLQQRIADDVTVWGGLITKLGIKLD